MRRVIVAALMAGLVVGIARGLPSNTAQASPVKDFYAGTEQNANQEWRVEECRFARLDGHAGWSQREVIRTIACAEDRWPVPGGLEKALAVARCESGLNPNASNGGSYLGLFQHSARYWPIRVRTLNPKAWSKPLAPSAFNARSNAVVSMRMASSGGWGPWTCA